MRGYANGGSEGHRIVLNFVFLFSLQPVHKAQGAAGATWLVRFSLWCCTGSNGNDLVGAPRGGAIIALLVVRWMCNNCDTTAGRVLRPTKGSFAKPKKMCRTHEDGAWGG